MKPFKMGYSAYLSEFENQKTFLESISKEETIIFTSLHIPEEMNDGYTKKMFNMLTWLKEKGFCIIGDISRRTLELFYCQTIVEVAKLLRIDMLRIDYGFSLQEIIEAAKVYPIVFNASTVDIKSAREIQRYAGNVKALHNFYPRAYTGLSLKQFNEINNQLQKSNIEVYSFIPNSQMGRGPIYEGLPTLEDQRDNLPYISALEMWLTQTVDCILLGDLEVSEQELGYLKLLENEHIVTIPIQLEDAYTYLYDKVYTIRVDSSDYALRLQESRELMEAGQVIEPFNCVVREIGNITCDNKNYLRYRGEIQIIKVQLPQDERVNVIGKIAPYYTKVCQYIPNGYKIKFQKYEV